MITLSGLHCQKSIRDIEVYIEDKNRLNGAYESNSFNAFKLSKTFQNFLFDKKKILF